jgi:hypothetical protein
MYNNNNKNPFSSLIPEQVEEEEGKCGSFLPFI